MKKPAFRLKNILVSLVILLGGLPILIMGFITIRLISVDMGREVRAKNLLIAQSLSSEVQAFLRDSLSVLRLIEDTIIERPDVKRNDVDTYLASILKSNLEFDSIVILDERGTVQNAAPNDRDVLGTSLSGQPFFSRARQDRQPRWSSTFISLQTGKPTITVAIPAKGGMMIVGYLNLATLNGVTDRVQSGELAFALMTDQEGIIIAHPDGSKVSERQDMRHLVFTEQKVHALEGSFTYKEDEREYLASLSVVPQTQWRVIVTVPADQAFASVARVRILFAAGAAIVLLLAGAIALFIVRKVSEPLSRLVRDARKVAKGTYIFEEKSSDYREIDELADNFHEMAEAIQDREKSLKEGTETLRAFFDAVHESMVLIDAKGIVLLSNMVGAQRLGMDVRQFVGTCLYDHFPPDIAEYRKKQYETVFATGEPIYFQDKRAGRFFEQHCFPVLGGDVKVSGVAIFAQEITSRKESEEKIRVLNASLEQRVRDRTVQLENANREMEAFAYSIAHDLRAPLRAISGFSGIVMEEYARELDTEGQRLLTVIRDNTRTMDELITDLLALSRVATGEVRSSLIDMAALACSVYNEMVSPEVRHKWIFSVAPLPEADGDKTLIRQVWINLLSNAIKFTSPHGEGRIDIEGHTEKGMNIYSVKDNGVGFNPDYAHKLFGVFQRLHKADEFEGTGVGLAIVQRIVTRHGGSVWAEGKAGEGATFYFSLPCRES